MTILLIQSAFAWEIQTTDGGAEYHWHQMPLDYVWVDDRAPVLEDLEGSVQRAFEAWSQVPDTQIEIESDAIPGAIGEVALNDEHVVYFEHDWPIGSEALAVATTWADERGRVVSFDIRVNAAAQWSTTGDPDRFDLQAAVTHEVGHVLGLEHSAVRDATMHAAHDLGEDWRQILHHDDEDGVRYLYDGQTLTGPATAVGCSTIPPTAWGWVLIPLTLLARRSDDSRRNRRQP